MGLAGMRERISALGGSVRFGRLAGARRALEVAMPLEAVDPAPTRERRRHPGAGRRRPRHRADRHPPRAGGRARASRWSARRRTAPRRSPSRSSSVPTWRCSTSRCPACPGLQTAAELRRRAARRPACSILSMHDNTEYVLESLRAGAHGYLLKDSAAAELGAARSAPCCRGESFFSPPVARQLGAVVRGESGGEPRRRAGPAHRPRAAGARRGRPEGGPTRRSRSELGISHRTVESHRESLMRKLDVYTVAGLTRIALEAGTDRTLRRLYCPHEPA